jgi:hypothetical protein
MARVQLGEPTLLTLGGWWATMAAVVGEEAWIKLSFVGKIQRARATVYRAFVTYA